MKYFSLAAGATLARNVSCKVTSIFFSCRWCYPCPNVSCKVTSSQKNRTPIGVALDNLTQEESIFDQTLLFWGSGAWKLPRDVIVEMDFGNFISSSAREIRFGSVSPWRASPSNTNLLDMNFASVENST
jgi:hypothetical protein